MIYIVDGPPGAGKSYFGTRVAVKTLLDGRRPCFTNYPVVLGDKSTFVWDYSLISEPVQDAVIIMDEYGINSAMIRKTYRMFEVIDDA